MVNPSVSDAAARCKAPMLTCLCSPTNHPGSFRCSRHRTPRGWPLQSSSSVRASLQQAAAPGVTWSRSSGGSRATSKGRPVLRAHLQGLLASPPPSSGRRDHRRCREFKPRLSRLGRLAAASSCRQPRHLALLRS
ncbi:uncharacterized protein LOC124690893 [Lolium rigidum]|uniref:uncharacterized protein LOC124690893 n=1 Tax=Lolium rigidum TaxID=89674 RepID=UPI001F5C80B3|nr:uncharacterized protein LOC124690893 [Lolium rigidum]XP_051196077.1 uncharacterized protein LOC127309152 [Lolium perenne]